MAEPRGLNGTCMARLAVDTERQRIATTVRVPSDLGLHLGAGEGAGEGNRTLMTSLEGWGSAIELRPRVPVDGVSGTGRASTAYRFHGIEAEPPDATATGQCWAAGPFGLRLDLAT